MPLLENVAVFDEPARHNLPWAAGFPRAGCSPGQVITGAGHVCRLRGFVLGEAGRKGREGGHWHPQQRRNKLGMWLSAAWSRRLNYWAPGRQDPSWVLHVLHRHVGARWRSATHLQAGAVPSGSLPGQAGGCNCCLGKLWGI